MDVGGDQKRMLQGLKFGGDVVVGTLGRTTGIFLAGDTLRVGAAIIAFIGTLGIGATGVGGLFLTGCTGIARGSERDGYGASYWKPDDLLRRPQRWSQVGRECDGSCR